MSDQLSTITNIVFIDAALPDYQTLIAGLPDNSTYFVLDAQKSFFLEYLFLPLT